MAADAHGDTSQFGVSFLTDKRFYAIVPASSRNSQFAHPDAKASGAPLRPACRETGITQKGLAYCSSWLILNHGKN